MGKARFERALQQFPHHEQVEVIWKSFQLNPGMKTEPGKNINEYLAEIKGWSLEQAKEANDYVMAMAIGEGLVYDFDKAVVANSFDAHRLIQLAKAYGKGNEMEEFLFEAYFTFGRNIADHAELLPLGIKAGLDKIAIDRMLSSDQYADKVKQDIQEAQQLGVQGVPFFAFNNKYAVSGAQPVETFLAALNQTWSDK
jgi:predicted DsbA family dithiol-disulfide isomerase